jgi:hypothetical protein
VTPEDAELLVGAHAAWLARSATHPTGHAYDLLQEQHETALARDRRAGHDHDGIGCWCCCCDCEEGIPPWTEDQVANLVRRQRVGHPYTCGGEHDGRPPLLPTRRGWVCPAPGCGYRQVWAHAADLHAGLPR